MVNKSPAQKVFILFLKFMKRCRAKSTLWEVDVSLSSSSELLSELDKISFSTLHRSLWKVEFLEEAN